MTKENEAIAEVIILTRDLIVQIKNLKEELAAYKMALDSATGTNCVKITGSPELLVELSKRKLWPDRYK